MTLFNLCKFFTSNTATLGEQLLELGESTYGLPVSGYKFGWKDVIEGLTTCDMALGR